MTRKTCVHNGNPSSYAEQHNMRDTSTGYVIPDWVHQDLSGSNEYWQLTDEHGSAVSMQSWMADIERRYRESVGQRMQAKSQPYKESIVVIDEHTTMDRLKDFASRVEQSYGVTALSIAIHRDEGYLKNHGKLNLHAHIIWDWTYRDGYTTTNKMGKEVSAAGKKAPHGKGVLRHLQDLAADALHMQRGTNSDRDHLNRVAYAAQQEEIRLQEAQRGLVQAENQLQGVQEQVHVTQEQVDTLERQLRQAQQQRNVAVMDRDRARRQVRELTDEVGELRSVAAAARKSAAEAKAEEASALRRLDFLKAELRNILQQINSAAVWIGELVERALRGIEVKQAEKDLSQLIAEGLEELPEGLRPTAEKRWEFIKDNVPGGMDISQVRRLIMGHQVQTPAGTWQIVKVGDGFRLDKPKGASLGGKTNEWVMD